ncbi:hypothetical protein BST61_g2895 [Cercospora zeina]
MTSRHSKRQKLDDGAPKSSPAPSRTPVTYGKGSKSSPAVNGNTAARSSSDAKAEWFAAKADVASARRRLRPLAREEKEEVEMDVYDDIEGAHRGGRPYIQRGNTDARKSRQKPALDPLRNQEDGAESPKKATKPTDLGFFKKFGKEEEGDYSRETSQSGGEAGPSGRAQRSAARTAGQGKGWITSTGPPKKTFEDEMREIQEHAQQETQDADSEDELVKQNDPKRTSARRPAQKAASVMSSAATTKTKKQALDRRKAAASREASLEIPESDEAERVVVDLPSASSAQESEDAIEFESIAPKEKAAVKPTRNSVALARILFHDNQLQCLRNIALEKATRKRPISLTNLDDEYAKVANVIVQTITAGESNSMLLIGARGSGKTAMIDQIIREQSKTHADDFHVVRLNGFIHTDDKIALRDIWRQLGKEMEMDEDDAVSKNYADTMTRLLALLSHPAENGIETEQVTKSVIFILDEFELFAGHPRQTLLYNLFDIAQSRKAPIAVLGLTSRIDVVESLEKRVKSRFSHRYVHLSLSKSLTAFEQICHSAIAIQLDELTDDEKKTIEQARAASGLLVKDSETDIKALANWNTAVNDLFASETCKNFLERLFYTTKSLPEFLTTLTLALSTLPTTSQTTNSVLEHFSTSFSNFAALQAPDSKLSLLPSLGTLQLALLVCAARLTNIYNTEIITFPLVYEEYKVLASKAKLQASAAGAVATAKVWGKSVGRGAWEGLIDVGLVMQDGNSGAGRVDVGLEELRDCGVDMGDSDSMGEEGEGQRLNLYEYPKHTSHDLAPACIVFTPALFYSSQHSSQQSKIHSGTGLVFATLSIIILLGLEQQMNALQRIIIPTSSPKTWTVNLAHTCPNLMRQFTTPHPLITSFPSHHRLPSSTYRTPKLSARFASLSDSVPRHTTSTTYMAISQDGNRMLRCATTQGCRQEAKDCDDSMPRTLEKGIVAYSICIRAIPLAA